MAGPSAVGPARLRVSVSPAEADVDREREVDLIRAYVAPAIAVLAGPGVPAELLDCGEYGARHGRATTIAEGVNGPMLYVACHVNAGGGRYALARLDHRSVAGTRAAAALVDALGRPAKLQRGKVW